MSQVIVFSNENGGVSVTLPTGELPIEKVLTNNCPEGAIIIDDSKLPTDSFDFWELINGEVIINESKKQAVIDAKQAVNDTKASALAKLAALGLTQDEVKSLIG
jgi:hypothetical protein